MQIPASELPVAASLLQDLEWLALEIERGEDRPESIARQSRAAVVLFSGLDEPGRAPVVTALLEDQGIDLNLVLSWFSAGSEGAQNWVARLGYVQHASRMVQSKMEHATANMPVETRDQLQLILDRRRTALDAWVSRTVKARHRT